MHGKPLTGSQTNHFNAIFETVVAALMVTMLALTALAGTAARAAQSQNSVRPANMTSGSLLLKTIKGGFVEAPLLATDYTVSVSGLTSRTILTQRFTNPAEGWVEGVYVFPLPETAAVDTLKIISGNRFISGEVREKKEAKIIYQKAKSQGRTASLLEQERPNIFTNSVANIGPGETVVVQIEYQEAIRSTSGTYSLRLPLVVAPRYNPAPVVQSVEFNRDGSGYGVIADDPVPDRDRITPPVLDTALTAPVNPVSISILLDAGFELDEVKSHHHVVKMTTAEHGGRQISLADGDIPADRDFELTWTALGSAPQVGLFKEYINGSNFLLAAIVPPSAATPAPALPRETIFVIDNSGSMDGPSMAQAKEALLLGLDTLTPQDRFNVIRFDDTFDMLFSAAVDADPEYLDRAKRFVASLSASGGTEMIPPLKAALYDRGGNDENRLRQVVFITDGAIGNEQGLFETLNRHRGKSRVFMVGIGSAPNTHLMTRAAEVGRGTFTLISDVSQVKSRMTDLFAKIGQPVVTELDAVLSDTNARLTPEKLPDLYRGEPVMMMAQTDNLTGFLTVSGQIGNTPWQVTLPLNGAAEGKGISKLWAHRKISELETSATLGEIPTSNANRQVLKVALTHQIVSSQTSLIAVDRSPNRPAGEPLRRKDITLNLPAGWNFEKVFGKKPPALRLKDDDLRDAGNPFTQLAVLDRPATVNSALQQQVRLPQTSTSTGLLALLGALFALLAGLLLLLARSTSPRAVA